jgi:hypothetical protein
MSGSELWLTGHGNISGTLMLLLWAAGVVTALVIVVGVLAYRDFAMRDTVDIFLRIAGVLVVAVLGWTWIDYSALREHAAERRALDARANELAARAVAPGSALACLTPVGIETVDAACEQAIFASPQTVAAAVAYVDAQLLLLADGLEYASRDKSYGAGLERPRRTLEADRFGFVAHVLETRGCTAEECAAFKLLRYANRVKSNLKDHAFEAHVTQYVASWSPSSVAASAAAPPVTSAIVVPPSAPSASTSTSPSVSRFSFPSSASIPPVSIMSAEPTGSTSSGNASAEPPAPEVRKPPARKPSANKPATASAGRLPPPPAPPPQRTQ